LLVAVFPANVHMALSGGAMDGLRSATWYYWVRLPFQAVYIWWLLASVRPSPRPSLGPQPVELLRT
jgi:uncharacterized membrane protein